MQGQSWIARVSLRGIRRPNSTQCHRERETDNRCRNAAAEHKQELTLEVFLHQKGGVGL